LGLKNELVLVLHDEKVCNDLKHYQHFAPGASHRQASYQKARDLRKREDQQ
jgi:hypothetical protein